MTDFVTVVSPAPSTTVLVGTPSVVAVVSAGVPSSGVDDGAKGDITVSSGGTVWTIDTGAVTLAKQEDVATARIMGRVTTSTGVQEALTGTQATTLLDAFTSGLKGVVPASGGGNSNFMRADGTWAAPAVSDGDKGDITVSSSGAVWTIDNSAVTLAKQADVATARLMGRVTASTGVQEALTGTQATTLIDVFTSGLKGAVPASGGGTTNFLRADGTFAAPGGGSLALDDLTDVVITGPVAGDILIYDGADWVNVAAGSSGGGGAAIPLVSQWAPEILGDVSTGSGNYTTNVGYFSTVGRLVTLAIDMEVDSHTGTGNIKFFSSGFPYPDTGKEFWLPAQVHGCDPPADGGGFWLHCGSGNFTLGYSSSLAGSPGATSHVGVEIPAGAFKIRVGGSFITT